MVKKIILLYPYFNGISGAYNRYILLNNLIKEINIPVTLITLNEKRYTSNFTKIIQKIIKYIKVESIIFYYCLIKKYHLITDFNPSIIALFSRKVFIQIHDVSWQNKDFARHNINLYGVLLYFIKNYSNLITVSQTSRKDIISLSKRKKRISYLYNSVSLDFIKNSNEVGKNKDILKNSSISKFIDFDLPNIIYIATLSPRKCHLDLIEALSKIKKPLNVNLIGHPSDINIQYLIKNNPKLSGDKVKSNINYFPKLSQKNLCTLLLYSSAYVSTSMIEGFGIPLLEAKLYNLPLIVRDIAINQELFPHSIFFNSIKELIDLLNDIKPLSSIEIKNRRKLLIDINQEKLGQLFNYSTLCNQLNNIINLT